MDCICIILLSLNNCACFQLDPPYRGQSWNPSGFGWLFRRRQEPEKSAILRQIRCHFNNFCGDLHRSSRGGRVLPQN